MPKNEQKKINKALAGQKFLVIAHSFGTGPPQELVKFLRKRVDLATYIDNPFFYSKDTRSAVTVYKNGREKWKKYAPAIKGPELFHYFKDIIITLYFALKTGVKYDICIACDPLNTFSALILRKLKKIKYVIYSAVDFTPKRFDNYFLNWLYHFINKICCYHSDVIWNSDKAMIEGRQKTGVKRAKSCPQIVVPDGNNFKEIKRYSFEKINRYDLVFMGHLRKNQGIPLLIDALPQIIKKVPQTRLVIVGTGPIEKRLKKQAVRLKIANKVIFKGFIEKHSELEKILAKRAVGLAPYVPDKKSFSFYSDVGKPKAYIACGLPVIITAVPGIAFEMAKNKAGILIEYNKDELVKAAVKLLKNDELYQQYRKNAIALAKKYEWSNVFVRGWIESFKILGIDIDEIKKIKVLVAISDLLPPAIKMAGLRIVWELYKKINQNQNIEIYILTSILRFVDKNYLDWIHEQRKKENLNIFIINDKVYEITITEFLISKLRFLIKAHKLNKKYNFDIIHDYSSAPIVFLFSFFYKRIMKKTVFHTLCTSNKGWLGSFRFNWGIRYIDRVICASSHIADKLKSSVPQKYKNRILYIPLGVNLNRFRKKRNKEELKSKLNIQDADKLVLFIGPLEKRKGAFVFAKSAVRILKKTNNIKFIFITYGDDGIDRHHKENKQKLLNMIKDYEKNIFILEGIQDIPSALNCADVFVLPPITSHGTLAQPLTLLEAMASGKAIIASKIDGIEEIIKHNYNGLLFKNSDDYELAKKITSVLKNKALAQKIVSNAKKDVKNYDVLLSAEKINGLYEKFFRKT